MSELDKGRSPDELWQEVLALRQEVAELKSAKLELELLQEVTTSVSDDVLTDLAQRNDSIRSIFGRYLTEEVARTLLSDPAALRLGGERRLITVLVADLRGFTALSEQLSAEDVLKMLNCYLGYMTGIIQQYDGTINDITGDGVMVLFGAPTSRPDDAQRAVTCAIAMQLAMVQVNHQMEEWQLPHLQMGIGINTGEAVVGNIGSEQYTKYSAIGKQVNLAYRIESYTVGGQILISGQTLQQVRTVVVDERIQIIPKGLSQPITVFSLKGIQDNHSLMLPQEEQLLRSLPQPIAVQCSPMEGKSVGRAVWQGEVFRLSSRGAELRLWYGDGSVVHVPMMSDLKLNLDLGDRVDGYSDDIYAKVLKSQGADGAVFIYFTTIRPAEANRLKVLYESIEST